MAITIEEAIVAFLKASTEVTAIIGAGNAARIYPEQAPQDAVFPYLTFTLVDAPQEYHLAGPSGLVHARVQIDCWGHGSKGKKDSVALAEAVRKAKGGLVGGRNFDGFFGDMMGLQVQWCKLVDRRHTSEPSPHAGEVPYRRASHDYQLWFVETA